MRPKCAVCPNAVIICSQVKLLGPRALKKQGGTLLKSCRRQVLRMSGFIALHQWQHYNARAKHRPAWKDRFHDATNRRLADGRGVFSAGGHLSLISKVLLAQLGLSVVLAVLFWGMDGRVAGYSALLGGLILNLMPCVLPVLAIKVFHIAELAHESRRRIPLPGSSVTL